MDRSLPDPESHVFQRRSHNQYTSAWFPLRPQPVYPPSLPHFLASTSMVGARTPYPPMSLFYQSYEEMLNCMQRYSYPPYFMDEGTQPWPSVATRSTPSQRHGPSIVELQAESRDALIDPEGRTTASLPGSTGDTSGSQLLNPPSTQSQGNTDACEMVCAPENPRDELQIRSHRLMSNRKAARVYRQKKKDYIRSLERREKELEIQNKALIEEIRAFKNFNQRKAD